jgi:RNA polymerase sigma-70 factor, ECF subfamily
VPQTLLPTRQQHTHVKEASDNELMIAIQRGDTSAFDVLMIRWELRIKAFVYRLTQAPSWVDELAQETFVKVYLNAHQFDTSRNFSPWIYRISANLCRNWQRWRIRHPSMADFLSKDQSEWFLEAQPEPVTHLPADTLEQHERLKTLKSAIARLPDSMRATLILHYYQGLSYDEIAEVQKCSRRGVETRLYRARKALQRQLEKCLADRDRCQLKPCTTVL